VWIQNRNRGNRTKTKKVNFVVGILWTSSLMLLGCEFFWWWEKMKRRWKASGVGKCGDDFDEFKIVRRHVCLCCLCSVEFFIFIFWLLKDTFWDWFFFFFW
jgi:hypothetical protein